MTIVSYSSERQPAQLRLLLKDGNLLEIVSHVSFRTVSVPGLTFDGDGFVTCKYEANVLFRYNEEPRELWLKAI